MLAAILLPSASDSCLWPLVGKMQDIVRDNPNKGYQNLISEHLPCFVDIAACSFTLQKACRISTILGGNDLATIYYLPNWNVLFMA